MEIEKTGKFITNFYGGAAGKGAQAVLEKYIKDQIDKDLLSFVDQIKKKGQDAPDILLDILHVFNRNGPGSPVLGNWMLKKCLTETGQTIFNAMKDKTHPKRNIIPAAISLIQPIYIPLSRNGEVIEKPEGVDTYTVTTRKRSFFIAYEAIREGALFGPVKIYFAEDLLSEEHMNAILEACGFFGVGAFRERFGKFVWV